MDRERKGALKLEHLFLYLCKADVNRKMVQEGMAWVYRQYLKDQSLLEDEKEARLAKRGIWSLPSTDQVPPWEWRKGNKSTSTSSAKPASTNVNRPKNTRDFTCGNKTKCGEMISCEEAMYYLKECGLNRLDGNSDGVPCERLCQ